MKHVQIGDHVLTEREVGAVKMVIASAIINAENVDSWVGMGPHAAYINTLRKVLELFDP
jgi:hypothetical protein